MRVFAIGVEHALDVTVQCLHDADPGEHCRPSTRSDKHQGFHRCLPFRRGMLGFRKLGDVVAGVLKRDELAAARQINRIFEWPSPPYWRLMQRGQPRGAIFGASGLPGQYFDLVEIQCFASASVSKSPTWESGPFPVLTATNQRPPLTISGLNSGSGFDMPLVCDADNQHSSAEAVRQANSSAPAWVNFT
jgi:hypothetical protein